MDKKNNSHQEEGTEMSLVLEKVHRKTSPLDRLKQRAQIRKNRTDLKHFPSKKNASVFNENFQDMETEINRTIR